jgi:hypothetical protein
MSLPPAKAARIEFDGMYRFGLSLRLSAAEEDLPLKVAPAYVQRQLAEQAPVCLLIAAWGKYVDPKRKSNHVETGGRGEAIFRFAPRAGPLPELLNLAEATRQQPLQLCITGMPSMSLGGRSRRKLNINSMIPALHE